MSKLVTRVYCTHQFEGFHRWPSAPDSVSFLRERHRHIFHVRAEKIVTDLDREVEFITLKHQLQNGIAKLQWGSQIDTRNWSCEMYATWLLSELGLDKVEVNEDGENGAVVEKVGEK